MPTSCTPRGPYSRPSTMMRSSTACTYGQWLQMNITTSVFASQKSSRATTFPSTDGRRKSGHGVPSGRSRLSVSAMRPRYPRPDREAICYAGRVDLLVDMPAVRPGRLARSLVKRDLSEDVRELRGHLRGARCESIDG